jgi:YD repeat-containing protein
MPWGVAAGAAIAAGGAYMQQQSAQDAAEAQANAYNQQSGIQYQRAQEAAGKVPEFKPVTVTSSFGTPQYTYDSSGRLTGVGSTAAPWLANLQQRGQGLAGQYMNLQEQALQNTSGQNVSNLAFGQAGNLYNLAGQALPTSYDTTKATQDYYNQMQGLVAADRERQLASTRQGLFNRGRQGLAIGATQAGGELATNPEMAAYYNAVAKQDAALALDAKSKALSDLQAQQNLGTGLLTAATQQAGTGGNALNQYYTNISAAQSPYTSGMAQIGAAETMMNQPVTQGMQYGGNVTTQANNIAQAYINAAGAGNAAAMQGIQAQYNADATNPWAGLLMGAGQAIGGANWGSLMSSGSSGSTVNSASTPTGYGNSANIYYGNRPQMFSNQTGWSY